MVGAEHHIHIGRTADEIAAGLQLEALSLVLSLDAHQPAHHRLHTDDSGVVAHRAVVLLFLRHGLGRNSGLGLHRSGGRRRNVLGLRLGDLPRLGSGLRRRRLTLVHLCAVGTLFPAGVLVIKMALFTPH